MNKHYEAILQQWKFTRMCTKEFITHLSDADLDRKLPRKGLDTFRKHFEEMLAVQKDFVAAIESGVMNFSDMPDDQIEGALTKDELLKGMEAADASFTEILENADEEIGVSWFGTKKHLSDHLTVIVSHETLHIGQIVAFCYVLGIEIPKAVKDNWALSG